MRYDRGMVSKVRTAAAACALGGLVAACSSGNSGFSDPVEDLLGDPMVMLGLRVDPNEEEIEYGPRSPLVMPPSADAQFLPDPRQPSAEYGAAWPDDPDVRARRETAELRKAAQKETPADVQWASKPMTPEDLNAWGSQYGRQNGAGMGSPERIRREDDKVVSSRELLDRRSDPNELRSEPPRATLTEPPPGYRTPAPPVEGAEPVEEKKGFFSRLFGRS